MEIRKTVTIIEETLILNGTQLDQPERRVAVAAVVHNPLAGRFDENLSALMHDGEDLGRFLAQRALSLIDKANVTCVGEGVITGEDGEPEHGAALVHPKFTQAVRALAGLEKTPIISEKKVGGPSTTLDVPLVQKGSEPGGGPLEVMSFRVPGSPRPDEILVVLVLGGPCGSRP